MRQKTTGVMALTHAATRIDLQMLFTKTNVGSCARHVVDQSENSNASSSCGIKNRTNYKTAPTKQILR
jgi:hypothetical protein